MLIYTPALDVHNCVYRFLLMLESMSPSSVRLDSLRMADYYLLYPHLIMQISPLPKELLKYKKHFKNILNPYPGKTDLRMIFYSLEPIHKAVIARLLAKGLLDIDAFASIIIERTSTALPDSLISRIKDDELQDMPWFHAVINVITRLETSGPTGLKNRSGLMEFRYDDN